MKGTIDRGLTYKDDIKQAQKLKNSRKEQNENNQIVDLMCNELEKIAVAHTVKVPKLHTIEKYPTLYQMTSTITAKIQDHIEFLDIFKTLRSEEEHTSELQSRGHLVCRLLLEKKTKHDIT